MIFLVISCLNHTEIIAESVYKKFSILGFHVSLFLLENLVRVNYFVGRSKMSPLLSALKEDVL